MSKEESATGKEKGALEVGFKVGSYLGSSQGLQAYSQGRREGGCTHMNGAIAPKRTTSQREVCGQSSHEGTPRDTLQHRKYKGYDAGTNPNLDSSVAMHRTRKQILPTSGVTGLGGRPCHTAPDKCLHRNTTFSVSIFLGL